MPASRRRWRPTSPSSASSSRSTAATTSTIDTSRIFEEIAARLREELDYGLEARHLGLYRQMLAGRSHVHVPRVVPELSTRRLITMEWLGGRRS
ncbi:MAG: AarF/UbiB family protein [Geminicoccaceae bacterium]